ncbi:dihydrofolate synthase/folylpolyglutamate synthase [Anoxybacillus vitaminiphilus]|uniref:Dihydrofolate synthase/folylpolyglutamate synthase n=1 Tax=Paranoxybacillus vitaminiphilus TaxID=581036 RepID=A0A327YKA1_9BACL|nr:folylpolyglutamate synthase/dihydrofolate synthase family protein [Anoxybacillus vitaminiphilus]RAK21370.1 dihydrofolate synthase/folylpolyglutamate synthase [Anoxybacillus vitaminiphilus]
MIRTYAEAVEWIHGRLSFGIKPGLKRMEWMMERLGYPQRRIKAIHVAGTNGKGSTVCYLRHILQEAGYSVGTFTSPYVEQFNERISVNGTPIRDEEIVELVNVIKPLVEEVEQTELGAPTEFEVITAMAMYYFGKMNIQDVVIFEAGLGGRFDSTNVIYPIISVITNVGFDHTNILGDTLEKIAFEKAGIIKAGVPVITGAEQEEALQVIFEKAKSVKAKAYVLGKDFEIKDYEAMENGERFSVDTLFSKYRDLTISMLGFHQVKNAALAVMTADYLKTYYSFIIEEEALRSGLEKATWIGRFEKICDKPTVIIDGAHNVEGINSLVETVKTHYPDKKIHVMFSALSDKPLENMIQPLADIAETITFTSFDFPRAAKAEEMYEKCKHENKAFNEDWKQVVSGKKKEIANEDVLLITGSLYFISEVRSFML